MPGMSVLNIPSPMPPMITVAGPVSACRARPLVILYSYEVKYSEEVPMSWPATSPISTTQNSLKSRPIIEMAMPAPTNTSAPAP